MIITDKVLGITLFYFLFHLLWDLTGCTLVTALATTVLMGISR